MRDSRFRRLAPHLRVLYRPQGAYHNVVRWVHRSSFTLRPPSRHSSYRTSPSSSHGHGCGNENPKILRRILIPGTDNLYVEQRWYGTMIVATEGTNESLAYACRSRCNQDGEGALHSYFFRHVPVVPRVRYPNIAHSVEFKA
jgi:hypothetical protein